MSQVERIAEETEGLSGAIESGIRDTAGQVALEAGEQGPELAAYIEEQGAAAAAQTTAAADTAAAVIEAAAKKVSCSRELEVYDLLFGMCVARGRWDALQVRFGRYDGTCRD